MLLSTFLLSGIASAMVIVPEPSGPYGVSLQNYEFIIGGRVDPYTGAPNRTIPISLIKPVGPSSQCHQARKKYMPNATANFLEQEYSALYGLDLNNTFSQVYLSLCKPNASQVDQPYPLVFFSPGAGTPRQLYHVLCTNIASYGYTVISVDAPGEPGSFVTYLDGSVQYGTNASITDDAAVDIRVQDIENIFEHIPPTWEPRWTTPHNLSKPSIFGHSFGGNAATSVMFNDTRFAGAANLDGGIDGIPLNHTTNGSYLLFASDMPGALQHNQSSVRGWAQTWRDLLGPKWQLQIENSTHDSFTDVPTIGKLLGLYSVPGITSVLGSIAPNVSLDIQVSVLRTFFAYLSGDGNVTSIIDEARTYTEVAVVNATNVG